MALMCDATLLHCSALARAPRSDAVAPRGAVLALACAPPRAASLPLGASSRCRNALRQARAAPPAQHGRRAHRAPAAAAAAATASGVTSAVASLVHAAGARSLLEALASLLGLAMGAGSLLLYSPIVLRLWRTRSAKGMAASTWALQLFGFTAVCIYNSSKGFPIAAYAETLSFTVQSGAILLLVGHLQGRLRSAPFAAGTVAYACLVAAAARGLPPVALSALQLAATVSVTGALLPQLALNARRRSSGGWSPLTAGLSAAGNALRVFTTLQLTRDALLLGGFVAGFAVNAALLAQIFVYGEGDDEPNPPAAQPARA